MSAATRTSRRRMGLTTLISSIFIVASLVWATYNFAIVQWGANRDYSPHFPYEYIPYWPYDNQFAGGRTNWFDNVNYTDVPLDQQLPDDILDQLDNIIFTVAPADPPQLWRVGAYDSYDGAHWGKTQIGTIPLDALTQLISTGEATNEIYTVVFNATAGANVGAIELPSLHPDLRVIEDSFVTWSIDGNGNPYPDPGRLLDYDLETDAYNTLLFTPFIQGTTGEEVIVTFQLSYDTQDLANVAANAQPGSSAPGWADVYLDLPDPLTQRVQDNISQFIGVGNNAYETAMAVNLYFQTTFNLTYTSLERPPAGQEVTDWFLERGGGLPMDFATAYCVFMRGLGIPARLTLGYAVGEADPTYSYRTLKVRHMAFWSEVFIPMSGATEGEWIQVVPLALPSDMGGDEVPTNAPIPNVQLNVWPSNGQPWEQIGTPFMLSANITVDGVPVTTPETITFYDETDTEFIGVQTIGQSPDKPIANVTYVFPSNATVDYHIIAATWTAANFSITNRTAIFAVGTPNPDSSPSPPSGVDGFVLSETRQLNVSQGVDTHFAFWEDTIHVYGTMKVGGVPVNSSKYDNRNIGIYWGNTFMGNASIDEYGYYELDIYVDPLALALMTVGDHEVWSWYLGDWDQYGIPRLNEARSGDNSTTEVWGRVGFNLTVLPTDVPAGSTIDYDGVVYFLNGTVLPMGQQVGVFFHSQANTTRGLNATGGFTWSYTIPVSQPDGTYFAYANWSSPWPLIAGNWSTYIPINVGSSGTQLSINQWLPDPYYVGYNITIFGYLTHVSNGTGIGGQWVDIWWNNGSLIHLGSVLTAPDGYYELNYTLLDSDDGLVEYWSNFTSLSPTLASCESIHRFLTVKKFDVSLDPIFVTPNPVFLLQPIDIQGNLSLSEFSLPLANQWVDFWLQNSTGVFYIGSVMTNSTGGYLHQYTIPIGQATETVTIWANYSSPYYNVYDGQSSLVPLDVVATGTLISIQEDFGTYYVNETVLLYGFLQFANGTPIASEIVYIHWVNATGTFVFQKKTDAFGYYQMLYNCTPTQDNPGSIDVLVNWTSWTPIYDNAFSSIAPQIQLQRYYLEIAITAPTQLYVDETLFDIQGVLTYLGGTPPLAGEEVLIQFWDGSGWYDIDNPTTNLTGGFLSALGFVTYDAGLYQFRALYLSSNPLNNDTVTYFDINRIKYPINLEVTITPNPVMQNETLTVHVYAYFAHNGTALSGASISLYWNNGTLPLPWLGDVITDGTGQVVLYYSGMDWDSVRTGIEVYGVYAGTVFHGSNESVHNILTLNQWLTTFTGVNLPIVSYRIGETVVVTGYLEYVSPSVPYGGVPVNLTLFGVTQATNITLSDGSFVLSWDIPGTLLPGLYDLFVEYNSPYGWIASTSSALPQIDVTAPQPIFLTFTVTPTTVYLDQSLRISGTVQWDNGTAYANLPLDIYWGDYFGTNQVIVNDYLTDGTGGFTINFEVPDDIGLLTYVQHVWGYIDPSGFATFGESPVISVTVDIYRASITTGVDTTLTYLGGTVTFSGTLQFINGTPMVGYDIQIWWGGTHLTTITITDPALGAFSYVHNVPYSVDPGIFSGYALFEPPTIAWGTADTSELFNSVTVLERVDIFMDAEPVDNRVSRGETLIITGDVLNDGGFGVDSLMLEATLDGGGTGATAFTAGDGSYTISLTIADNQPRGSIIISVRFSSSYHELRNGPTTWLILVYIDSDVYVSTNLQSLMPGETFSVDVRLADDDGFYLNSETVSLYLGSTHLGDVLLSVGSGMSFQYTVPLSWDEGDGIFNITADYDGALYINPSSYFSDEGIHVFTDVIFASTPRRVDPNQPFIIEVSLQDPDGRPIMFRTARLNYNGTAVYPYFVDETGTFQHQVAGQSDGSIIRFTVTLVSFDIASVQSNPFTINIQTTGGNPLQGTDLLIASILLVGAVIAVLAYLYIVRGMFRSPIITRGIDIPTKLRNIKKLADAGKYGASITLAYRTFEQMCGHKMGSERTHSETAREYLERVLQTIPLDGATVEQFVQTYEEARFSHHEMTRERYEEAVRIFTDLYPRIDSTSAPAVAE